MRSVVGISFKIKRAWLDAILDRLAETTDEEKLRAFLDDLLKEELPGKETRAKTSGIILNIWGNVPRGRVALRDRAVALLPRISGQERIWLHWGMTTLAYPFFRDTTEVVGRLLALQDDFTTAQVQARILTTWGDRVTSKRAAQYLLNTLVDWEVLRATKARGHFLLARRMTARTPELQLWLLEALLGANAADEIESQQLLRLPEAFPFTLSVGVQDLRRDEGFDIHRQGLDMDMVALRRVKLGPPPKKLRKKAASRVVPPGLFDEQAPDIVVIADELAVSVPATAPAVKPGEGGSAERGSSDVPIEIEVQRSPTDHVTLAQHGPGPIPAPDDPFAAPIAECFQLFRDGHYLGCIALTQAVLEATVRHVSHLNLKKKANKEACFEKDIEAIHGKKLIGDTLKARLLTACTGRPWLQQFSPPVKLDRRKLEGTARTTLDLLEDFGREFFGIAASDCDAVPGRPGHWPGADVESSDFVRDTGEPPGPV